jgi:hypothetical protein
MASEVTVRLKSIQSRGRLSLGEIADLAGVVTLDVFRWHTGVDSPTPEQASRLRAIESLVGRLAEMYTPEALRTWLYSSDFLLDGERPADHIRAGNADKVLSWIAPAEGARA